MRTDVWQVEDNETLLHEGEEAMGLPDEELHKMAGTKPVAWEAHLAEELGKRLQYRDGKRAMDDRLLNEAIRAF